MNAELIDTFLDLAETRSFNRTADRLGITQSTVSSRIASLERSVGGRLFTRSRAGTALTTTGLRFEPHARILRRSWVEALRASQDQGTAALSLRIGLQMDLVGPETGAWVTSFRNFLPESAFYIELDNSAQMCVDLLAGHLDLAVLYTPRTSPDLHFESVGEVLYRLVSSDGETRSAVNPDRYIRGDFSPAFKIQHDRLYPAWTAVPLACGHSTTITRVLATDGGSAFLREDEAERLVATGDFAFVTDAAPIAQTIHAALGVRQKHEHAYRRLVGLVRERLARKDQA